MSVTFYPNLIHYSGYDAAAEPTNNGETFTSSGGETTGVLYDLTDNRRTNKTTWDTSGQSVDTTIRVDTTASMSCDYCIIDNHNLNAAITDIDIEQGGSNITLTTSYSGTLGSELTADAAAGVPDADGITLIQFTAVADTQWEVELNDTVAIGNFEADIYIGEIALGNYYELTQNPELQPNFGYDFPGSSYRETDGGQRYGFSTHENSRRSWRMTWKYLNDNQKLTLETNVFKFTRGMKYPFYIDLAGPLGNTSPTLYYVRFMRPLSFTGLTKDAWQVTMDIEEEI